MTNSPGVTPGQARYSKNELLGMELLEQEFS